MKHIFQVNVAGEGYRVAAGDPRSGFSIEPMDVVTENISRSYLSAKRRIREALRTRMMPWSLAFRSDAGALPIVMYGGFIDASDDKGRRGIMFSHALELPDASRLDVWVHAIVQRLSNHGIRQLTQLIADVAVGAMRAEVFLTRVSGDLDGAVTMLSGRESETATDPRIGDIVHDCAGAAALAWRVMGRLQRSACAPWEVYDKVDLDGVVHTIRLSVSSRVPLGASEILGLAVDAWVPAGAETPAAPALPETHETQAVAVKIGSAGDAAGLESTVHGRQDGADNNDSNANQERAGVTPQATGGEPRITLLVSYVRRAIREIADGVVRNVGVVAFLGCVVAVAVLADQLGDGLSCGDRLRFKRIPPTAPTSAVGERKVPETVASRSGPANQGESRKGEDVRLDATRGRALVLAMGLRVVVEGLYLGPDVATLSSAAEEAIRPWVTLLMAQPDVTVVVEAHTERSGDEGRNVALSQQRAKAVHDFFVRGGIEPGRIAATGLGSAFPLAGEPSASPKNRRIEIVRTR